MAAPRNDDRDSPAAVPHADTPPPAGDSYPATGAGTPLAAGPPAGVPAELANHPVYEVLKELGRGGMGVVYLARNREMGRLEVLKVIQERLAAHPDLLQRFRNEIQMAAKLLHPNIVVAYATFRAGGALVLAMEHVDGVSLADMVRRRGALPVAQACSVVRQAALGLQAAHEAGMVHRDIKPHNLMLSRQGVVKVLDFGLAKVQSEAAETGLTGSGMMMGTPDYMPPEQSLNAKKADIRADIYALGCTLYFLIAGRAPYAGESAFEVMQAHHAQPVPPLEGVPAGLAELVAAMMAKRPEERPGTPGEVARALGPYCKAEAGREKRPSLPPPPLPARVAGAESSTPRRAHDGRQGPASSTRLLRGVEDSAPATRRRVARGKAFGPVLAGAAVMLAVGAVLAVLWAGGVFSGGRRDGGIDLTQRPTRSERPKPSEDEGKPVKEDEKPKPAELPKSLTNTVGMELVLIPKGKFQMGSPAGEADRDDDEGPVHEVELTRPFYMGKYEVTQGQYERVTGRNPSYFSAAGGGKDRVKGEDTSRFPVESVSWEDAVEFCRRLTEKERKEGKILPEQEYRLPSEAQWEYSCRGGAVSKPFHFGDQLSSDLANFDGNFPYGGADKGPYLQRTTKVGSYRANGYGLYDMHGNVREWCRDWYDANTYKAGPYPRRDPPGPPQGSVRVFRGGCWFNFGRSCRSAHRDRISPGFRYDYLGFRVVLVSPGGE